MLYLKRLSLLIALLLASSFYGANVGLTEELEHDTEEDLRHLLEANEKEFFDFLDTPHEIISIGVDYAAKGLDVFFADEKIYDEATNSYAKLSYLTTYSHGGETTTIHDLHIKIDLKKTKKKLKLLLESDTDRDVQTGTDSSDTPGQAKEPVSFYAALEKEISRKNKWRTKASLGIKLRVPLDPYIRLRAHKDFKLGDWSMRFTETLSWFNSKGLAVSSVLNFSTSVSQNLTFSSSTTELWTDFLDYHELAHSFTLSHKLSERRAVSYNVGVNAISHPITHMTSYYASMGYRQRIHRDWLYIEASPAITFARGNNFQDERSFYIRLEMVFGNKYVYRPPKPEEE